MGMGASVFRILSVMTGENRSIKLYVYASGAVECGVLAQVKDEAGVREGPDLGATL
jgi:hypothetical protein